MIHINEKNAFEAGAKAARVADIIRLEKAAVDDLVAARACQKEDDRKLLGMSARLLHDLAGALAVLPLPIFEEHQP